MRLREAEVVKQTAEYNARANKKVRGEAAKWKAHNERQEAAALSAAADQEVIAELRALSSNRVQGSVWEGGSTDHAAMTAASGLDDDDEIAAIAAMAAADNDSKLSLYFEAGDDLDYQEMARTDPRRSISLGPAGLGEYEPESEVYGSRVQMPDPV